MDKVCVRGLEVWGHHGALPEERVLGQVLVVDVEVGCDLKRAGTHDDLSAGISYVDLVEIARETVSGTEYLLLEAVAESIAEKTLNLNHVSQVVVRVAKPRAPIPGLTGTVSVEITREKG